MADPNVPNPEVEGDFNKIRKDVGSGVMDVGFAMLGSTFGQAFGTKGQPDENVAAAVRGLGDRTRQALEKRWYQHEYENWAATYYKPYVEKKIAARNSSMPRLQALNDGVWINPDGSKEKLNLKTPEGKEKAVRYRAILYNQMKDQISSIDMDLATSSQKYAGNPFIENQVAQIFQQSSQALQSRFNPEPVQKGEESVAGIDLARAQAEHARMTGQASLRGGASQKGPQTIQEAYDQYGAAGLPGFLLGSPAGQKLLTSGVGKKYYEGAMGKVKQEIIQEKGLDPYADAEEINNELGSREAEVQKLAAGELVKNTLPATVTNILQQIAPDFYPEPKEPPKPGVYRARPKAVEDQDIAQWKDLAVTALEEYIGKSQPKSIDEAISFVMDNWLPMAMRGNVQSFPGMSQDEAMDKAKKYSIADTPATNKFRERLTKEVLDYLKKNWTKSELAKETYPKKAKQKETKEILKPLQNLILR